MPLSIRFMLKYVSKTNENIWDVHSQAREMNNNRQYRKKRVC